MDEDATAPTADLHVHTTASDGRMTVAEIPDAARRAGVDVVAVTDHDVVHPDIGAPVVEREGVRLVRGIELRVDTGPQRVDLLGYGVAPSSELTTELRRIQRDRMERGERLVACVEDRLGVELDVDIARGVGRPHVARAIAESDADYDYDGAFEHLIGSDCPCFIAREVTDFERGVRLLRDSCALVGLAHPFRYRDTDAALSLLADLDAVERWYPYGRAVDTDRLDAAIAEHGLVPTGGSDAHDDRLGVAGLDRAAYARIADRFPTAETEA